MIRSIFSIDQRGGFGNGGTLPWPRDDEDMQWFREATENHIVVMGRRTWEDPKMPKPLLGRKCVVLTKSSYVPYASARKGDATAIVKELQKNYPNNHVWIIGGADLLMETKDACDEMWIAHRKGVFYTDVRLDMHNYMLGTRIMSSRPNEARSINWCTYKNINIFRPL